jgi:DNA-binding NtrC family response regulator
MPPKRILVVDDDASIRRLVATVLKRENYDVDTADSGRHALAQIELTEYDVVVLDLMMPEISGKDVLKRLEVRNPQIKCVIIMSAASRFEIAKATTPNVFTALPKPFEIKELITAVAGCLEAGCAPAEPPTHLQSVPKAA